MEGTVPGPNPEDREVVQEDIDSRRDSEETQESLIRFYNSTQEMEFLTPKAVHDMLVRMTAIGMEVHVAKGKDEKLTFIYLPERILCGNPIPDSDLLIAEGMVPRLAGYLEDVPMCRECMEVMSRA